MTWASRGKTAVDGIGTSTISRKAEKPLGLLALDACRAALEDAGVKPEEVDGLVTYPDQPFLGAGNRDGEDLVTVNFLIDHGGLAKDIKWYSQISSGMIPSAFIEGVHALSSGTCNYVLVWRAMHLPQGTYGAWRSNRASGDTQFTAPFGAANPFQWHGLAYQRYMDTYGAKREHMATLVTNSRHNANLNEAAYFYTQPMSFDDYMNARMISDPLSLFDCDIPVEGCIALLLTTGDRATDLKQKPAYIAGFGQQATKRPSLTTYTMDDHMICGGSTTSKIWEMSGLGPKDIQAAQLYDGFSPSTYYWLEAAGFCGRGEAWQFVQDGRVALDGELPVNTFGGSLSEGRLHGMGHLAEAVRQVTGRAGPRQVANCSASIALDGSPMLRNAGILFTSEP